MKELLEHLEDLKIAIEIRDITTRSNAINYICICLEKKHPKVSELMKELFLDKEYCDQ